MKIDVNVDRIDASSSINEREFIVADLGEYLGHLLCEVARARVRADMEAVRIAHEYVNDDSQLLRHFAVPRMRLPTLEISLPVQIDRVPEGYAEKTSADTTLLSKVIVQALGPVLKEHKLHITTSEVTRIIKADPRLSGGELYEGFSNMLSAQLHDHTRAAARSRLAGQESTKETAGETFKKVAAAIRESVNTAIQALPRKPVGIAVEARTAAIREIGNPSLLVNLKLSISEEALEIHLEEPPAIEGKPDPAKPTASPKIKRLLPE